MLEGGSRFRSVVGGRARDGGVPEARRRSELILGAAPLSARVERPLRRFRELDTDTPSQRSLDRGPGAASVPQRPAVLARIQGSLWRHASRLRAPLWCLAGTIPQPVQRQQQVVRAIARHSRRDVRHAQRRHLLCPKGRRRSLPVEAADGGRQLRFSRQFLSRHPSGRTRGAPTADLVAAL